MQLLPIDQQQFADQWEAGSFTPGRATPFPTAAATMNKYEESLRDSVAALKLALDLHPNDPHHESVLSELSGVLKNRPETPEELKTLWKVSQENNIILPFLELVKKSPPTEVVRVFLSLYDTVDVRHDRPPFQKALPNSMRSSGGRLCKLSAIQRQLLRIYIASARWARAGSPSPKAGGRVLKTSFINGMPSHPFSRRRFLTTA